MADLFTKPNQWLMENEQQLHLFYCFCLSVLFFAFLLSLPLFYSDTDLWYHLTGGRYFLEHYQLYDPQTQSFLESGTRQINYFWGFQALTYLAWLSGHAYALIVLKAFLFACCAYFVSRVILGRSPGMRDTTWLHLLEIA